MKRILVFALAVAAAWLWLGASRPRSPVVASAPPAVTLEPPSEHEPPRQHALEKSTVFEVNGYELHTLRAFALKARVLSVEHYRTGREADLSPTDIAFGWGRMADPGIVRELSISQSGRWYFWRYSGSPPLPPQEIVRSSANMHLIPADAAVARALGDVKAGEIVALRGYLVEARGKDGWLWRSSLTREDTGNGSCELVFVQRLERH